ncbi:MAG: glycine cleavage system aminomethyltransferase GcvT [Planctomycetales bacterium]|nr:glycine cleavage system aminomethyltransferase GcvT [Planctomycetales bacterium]
MTTANDLARTPLYQWHVDNGARMVDFAGWSMPIQYSTITAEHIATRTAVTLFDVSHMGRFRFSGPHGLAFLDSLLTRRVDNLAEGRIRYSLVTNEAGGILDDILAYHMPARGAEKPYAGMVVNGSNREKLSSWFQVHVSDFDVGFSDDTLESAMIAVQGPKAIEVAQRVTDLPISQMKYFTVTHCPFAGADATISRTGYTGEDGIEVTVPAAAAEQTWLQLLEAGEPFGICPAGLGARDTLRLEAAMPLYGHELSENISAAQTGLNFALDLDGRRFPGCDVIAKTLDAPDMPCRVGLKLTGKRVPREDYRVFDADGNDIGVVTSGTFSPTLECPLAMAYVSKQHSSLGLGLNIDIRGKLHPAEVVALPFYKRTQ